ncbi:putative membrane protein [Hymenobacter daecheongensis DSM 21074]|uniref:Putative membrane protein n=1 Tax=Hymenobacter daecheongensis DSM 21074 TaxID=1121955 RepID=A0A1M6LPI6_9BACT|nr:bestrophin family ion channel [Hymenobacter daecheongensis]SHJ73125.1 putative membrane protein [Hymenobacter daecheongensis DSM 21074]
MYVRRIIRFSLIMRFAWRNLLGFTLWSGLLTLGYGFLIQRGIDIRLPFAPLSTIGIAVAFYLGFKNSQSYDRFWEARKIWGGIVNASRLWGSQICAYVAAPASPAAPNLPAPEVAAEHRTLLYRQLAWLNALRLQLRRTTIYDRQNVSYVPDLHLTTGGGPEPEVEKFLAPAEYARVCGKANAAAQLLHQQALELQRLQREGLLDDFRHIDLMQTVKECYSLQGMCERIKNTPFPRQYAYFSTVFVWIFVLLLPLGLISEFSKLSQGSAVWLTVPFSVLISWIFLTIEIVGDNSEDPFENYVNDVPMTDICRTIEIDLREMLGETDLPERIQPVNDVLL